MKNYTEFEVEDKERKVDFKNEWEVRAVEKNNPGKNPKPNNHSLWKRKLTVP